MSKKSIAIIIFATLLLSGCATDTPINTIPTTESEAISTSTTSTTASTTESNYYVNGRSSMSGGMFGGRNNTNTSSADTDISVIFQADALYQKGVEMIKEQKKDVYNCDNAKIVEALSYLSEALRLYNQGLNSETASEVQEAANAIAKITFDYDKGGTIWSDETVAQAKAVHESAVRLLEKSENPPEEVTVPGDVEFEIDEDNQIQGVTSTTTVTITPDIEVEDTDIEVGVFDEDDIKTDVNAGVSNEYGKVGNYTNTSYNEEWGRLGAADPLATSIYFSDSQTEDLMKFIKSGYMAPDREGNMIKDPRIASRAGGIDNPRRPWWTDVKDASDLSSHAESDACWLVVTKNANITQDVVDVIESTNRTDSEVAEVGNSLYGSDMCPGMEVTYSARNYCGDIIRIHVGGNEINHSGKSWTAITENGLDESSVPGIDFKVECKEDPSAIRLLTAEESQTYAMSTGFGGGMAARFALTAPECGYEYDNDLDAAQQAPVSNHTSALDNAEYSTESFYTKDGDLISAGYIATKPGIFTCTVTNLANGDTVDIVIENLPVHYKELKWGCSTQREMDVVVGYHLNNPDNGLFAGDFQGVTNLYRLDGMGTTVSNFNKTNYTDIDGKSVQLKDTPEAEEFCKYKYTYAQIWNKSKFGYNGYSAYGYLTRGQGECEAISADTQAALCLGGITSRYVGNHNHAWVEYLVPASIATDGQDHWISTDVLTPTWRSSNIIEGWDYWK